MPELPDLEVIREFLAPRIAQVPIVSLEARRPFVIRNLLGEDLAKHLVGQHLSGVHRRGKFLIFPSSGGACLVIHPMLAGRIRFGAPQPRNLVRDALVISFENGCELRYHDAKDMGKVYLVDDLDLIPTFDSLGPEANDPALTLEVFRQRLSSQRGEIKRILGNQSFVAGIGNAYADEICWQAKLYPFRQRSTLTDDDVQRLHYAMQWVLSAALDTLRSRVGDAIHVEIRDFLSVHGKAGEPCPRCGTAISEVKRERRATHFCRTCQPGLMVGRGRFP